MTAGGTSISIDSATWIFPQILWGNAKNDNAIGKLYCAINSSRNPSEKIDGKVDCFTDLVYRYSRYFDSGW